MKKSNIILSIFNVILSIALIVMILLYLNAVKTSKNNLESQLAADEVFELNKKINELEEELEQYKTSFTVEIVNIDGTETKTLTNATKLKEKLDSLEYSNELCQGISDYVLKCYDGTVYYIKSECKGIQKNGKESVLSDDEMEEIKDLILNHNIKGENAIEEEININTTNTANVTINTISSDNVTNTTTNNTKVTGSGSSKATSTEPYIPDGMQVADPNDNSGIKASDVKIEYDINKVKIEILKDTITNSSVEILITDNNENSFGWGKSYRIQKKENGNWNDLKPIQDLAFEEIAFMLDENNQLKQKINWEKFYGELEKGTYRIVKPIYNNGYVDLYSNEFEIK